MTLDGAGGYTIYGVLPPCFSFPSHSDLYRSNGIGADPSGYMRRDVRSRFVIARLRDGATIGEAQRALDALVARLATEFPDTNAGLRFQATLLRELTTAHLRPLALLLSIAVLLVLLVACVNVAT